MTLEPGKGTAAELEGLLTDDELSALIRRLDAILENRALPRLDPYQNVPWPWV